jgi:hypothetical protein
MEIHSRLLIRATGLLPAAAEAQVQRPETCGALDLFRPTFFACAQLFATSAASGPYAQDIGITPGRMPGRDASGSWSMITLRQNPPQETWLS